MIRLETIDGKKLALLLMSVGEDDFEDAVCITGRMSWDGRRLCAQIDHGTSFAVPLEKLDHVRAVPDELRGELDDADLYVTLQVSYGPEEGEHSGHPALGVRWPD